MANPRTEAQGEWIFDGKLVGFSDLPKKFAQGGDTDFEGAKALDDYTLQLKLTKKFPQLLYILTMNYSAPVPHEAVEAYGKDFVNHPVGTGPFRAKSYNPTSQIILVRNENFRDEFFPGVQSVDPKYRELAAAYIGKKLPLADAIVFDIVKEEQPRWLGFMSGKFDEIEIPKDNFDSAIRNKVELSPELAKKGVAVSIEPAYSFWYVSINMKDSVVGTNKYLRQAIASAIPQEDWLRLIKNNRGAIQNEVSPIAIKDRCGKPYRWAFSLERAKQLLAKAGFPNGKGLPTLKWDMRNTEVSERQIAEIAQRSLAKIGIQLEVIANTFPAYLDKMHKGNLQISKGGWIMDYPDTEDNYQLLYGPNKSPGPNEANYDNPDVNKLYEQIAVMTSSPERRTLICKMEELIQEDTPWAYGIYEDLYRLSQRWIKNFHTAELVYSKWKYVDVNDQEKAHAVASR